MPRCGLWPRLAKFAERPARQGRAGGATLEVHPISHVHCTACTCVGVSDKFGSRWGVFVLCARRGRVDRRCCARPMLPGSAYVLTGAPQTGLALGRCFRPCLYLSRVVPPLTQARLFRPQHKRVVRHSMPAQRYARGSTFSSIVVDRRQKARYRLAFQDAKVRWWLRLARLAERVAMQGRAGGETEEQSAHRCTPECAALP